MSYEYFELDQPDIGQDR